MKTSNLATGNFNTLPLMVELFSETRITEVTRRLRRMDLFYSGAKEVNHKQAALLIYLLAADKGPDSTIKILDQEPIKDGSGQTFIKVFAEILEGAISLKEIIEIYISPEYCEVKSQNNTLTFGKGSRNEKGLILGRDKLYYFKHYLLNGWERSGMTEQTQKIQKDWLGIEPEFTFPASNPDDDMAVDLQNVKGWEQPGVIDNFINNLKTN